jgi:hypothetical protein
VIEDHEALAKMAVELDEARRFRGRLFRLLAFALPLQAVTYLRLVYGGTGWTASVLATFVSAVVVGWTWITQLRIVQLEDEVDL